MAARLLTLLDARSWHVVLAAMAAGLALSAQTTDPALPLVAALVGLVAHAVDRGRPAVLGLAALALAAGSTLGCARVAALDAPAERVTDGAALSARALVLSHPRPSPFGSSVELQLRSGPLRGTRLLGRMPRWGPRRDGDAIGTELHVRGRLRSLDAIAAQDRRREFQVAAWLRQRRLAGELLVSAVGRPTGRRGGVPGMLDRLRARAERGVAAGLAADRAALLRGMVLGQDEAIPEPQRDEFRAAGLAHILAVSGQNVMLLVALALPLLIVAGLGSHGRGLVLLGLIALYVPLAGAGPSLQRAGLMGAAGIAATLAARPASRWYALLLAAVITLALDPRACGDPGWQLSFAAVAGILIIGRPLAAGSRDAVEALLSDRAPSPSPGRRGGATRQSPLPGAPIAETAARRVARTALTALADGLAITVAATLATAPLLAYRFGTVSLAALPANVLALPLVAPAMWLGMLKAALGQLSALGLPDAALASALGAVAAVPLAGIVLIAERFAALPGAELSLSLGSPVALALAYVLLGAAVLTVRRRVRSLVARAGEGGSRWRRLAPTRRALCAAAATLAATLAIGALLAPSAPPRDLTVRFLDVGQGDATLIQHPDGTAILFDGGPPEAGVTRLLRRAGVRRLALVVATHASRDHHGGLPAVLSDFPVELLLDGGDGTRDPGYRALLAEADRRGVRRLPAVAPLDLRAGGLHVRVLSPPPRPPGPPPEDPNPRAITAVVSAGDFELLLSGDAESPTLGALPLPDVDALKVPHHGSADPGLPTVLERARPELAGIEVGRGNGYGHPAPETLGALRAAGVRTYRTDRDGTVSVTVRDGAMEVETGR